MVSTDQRTATSGHAESQGIRTRVVTLDNAKGLLIFLVIFGHVIEQLTASHETIRALYLSIYSFHMPAFVMLAGMTSAGPFDISYFKRLVGTVLIPFVVFTALYELLQLAFHGSISDYSKTFQPYWLLWFLLSLFCWRIVLPVIEKVPGAIFIAIAVSVAAGYCDSINNVLGVSRTLYFFPFFLIGYRLTPRFFEEIRFFRTPVLIAAAILIANLAGFYLVRGMPAQWLYGSMPYSVMHISGPLAGFLRAGLYAVSLTSVMAILLIVPRRESLITSWGKSSLITYLLHGLIVKSMIFFGLMAILSSLSPLLSLPISLVTSFLLTAILSAAIVQFSFRAALSSLSRWLSLTR
jgi:fucose 4-O-acetylase-like acetyltransferase